ncbi:MAG TPA: Holliday junction resolvase RuvX [Candidatus Paceibacterota bacterium]
MKYLGIDYGAKRIGLAVSDAGGRIAFPRKVLANEGEKSLRYVALLCEKEAVGEVVFGQSLDYKGRPNPIQTQIENWKLKLEKLCHIPVYYQQEVLTSFEAARNTGKEMLDASAAALILQSYLDRI